MSYARLNAYGEIVRDWIDIKRITNAFTKYKATNDISYIKEHMKNWDELKDLLDEENPRIESLATQYWDILHPLCEEDKKRLQRINRQRIINLFP